MTRFVSVLETSILDGLHTNIARLPLRVRRARLDRGRDGLLVFFVGVVLLRAATTLNSITEKLVAAEQVPSSPVVLQASGTAVSRFTSYASRRVVGQWGGAGGAMGEDHFALVWRFCELARR